MLSLRAIAGFQRTLGSEHPETCQAALVLALNFEAQKEFAKAIPLAQQSLKGWAKALGPEHLEAKRARRFVASLKEKLRIQKL